MSDKKKVGVFLKRHCERGGYFTNLDTFRLAFYDFCGHLGDPTTASISKLGDILRHDYGFERMGLHREIIFGFRIAVRPKPFRHRPLGDAKVRTGKVRTKPTKSKSKTKQRRHDRRMKERQQSYPADKSRVIATGKKS